MISNCGSDERGKYSGGQAGDQTSKEWRIREWYNRPWNCVIRFPENVRNVLAKYAYEAAKNDNVGYDQSNRLSFYNELKKVGYDPAKIQTKCEADCSSGVAAIVIAAGYKLDDNKLKRVSPSLWTGNMRRNLREAGGEILTDSKYLTSDKNLLKGDILLNDAHHTCINVGDCKFEDAQSSTKPSSPLSSEYKPVTDQVVNDVIAGKYGNGDARKSKLAAAGYNYKDVQAAVNAKLKAQKEQKPADKNEEGFKPYLVRVNIPNLNIRTSPGKTANNLTGKFTGVGTFTIVDEINGWGKLKSGAGWICLDTKFVTILK